MQIYFKYIQIVNSGSSPCPDFHSAIFAPTETFFFLLKQIFPMDRERNMGSSNTKKYRNNIECNNFNKIKRMEDLIPNQERIMSNYLQIFRLFHKKACYILIKCAQYHNSESKVGNIYSSAASWDKWRRVCLILWWDFTQIASAGFTINIVKFPLGHGNAVFPFSVRFSVTPQGTVCSILPI